MHNKEEILELKLRSRFCRSKQRNLPEIKSIVEECSAGLGMRAPKLICCESLTRSFNAFYLMGEPYIIYDACLIEALYIYDLIMAFGAKVQDMDKFFYKLFGEECIRNRDLNHALFFAKKYRGIQYSFEYNEETNTLVSSQIASQHYFLIGHELGHLKLKEPNSEGIPAGYMQFIRAAIGVTTRREMNIKNLSIAEYALKNCNFFPVSVPPQTLYDYLDMLMGNAKFMDFVEECYCDLIGYRLMEHKYRTSNTSVNEISKALNYLITQEAIRSDLHEGVEQVKNVLRDGSATLFYSVKRVLMLLLALGMNHNGDMELAYVDTRERDQLTDRLNIFIQEMPDQNAMNLISDADMINNSERLEKVLMQEFYYCSVSP